MGNIASDHIQMNEFLFARDAVMVVVVVASQWRRLNGFDLFRKIHDDEAYRIS